MPRCTNSERGSYAGTEPSPKGRGRCAHGEVVGARAKGTNGLLWEVKENVNGVKRWQKVSGDRESPTPRRRAASPARPTSRPANQKAPSTMRRTASPKRYRAATDITMCDYVIVTIGALATSLLRCGVPTSTLTNASRSAGVTIGAVVPASRNSIRTTQTVYLP
jgi:hypothetical protein